MYRAFLALFHVIRKYNLQNQIQTDACSLIQWAKSSQILKDKVLL